MAGISENVLSNSAATIEARDIAYVLHPYTNVASHEQDGPVVISAGDGIYVMGDKGRGYIEALSGLFNASLGFSEPRLVCGDAADEDAAVLSQLRWKNARAWR